jgi:hypothetical protein
MQGIGWLPYTDRWERTPLSATGAWVRAAAGDLFILHPPLRRLRALIQLK